MKQFDLFANPFPRNRERQPLLIALQSDLLSRSLDTVVLAPLETADSGKYADRLNPRFNVEEKAFTLITQEIVAVRKSVLGASCGSLAHERDHIIAALDMLFTGF
jgi:toxin CcdB